MIDVRTRRSVLNLIVLAVFALAVTVFLLNKAKEAIAEIDKLANSPAYLGENIK